MKTVRTALLIAWASPASLLGVLIGVLGPATGGGLGCHRHVLEFWGVP